MTSEAETIYCADEMNIAKMNISLTIRVLRGISCNFGNFPFFAISWSDNLSTLNGKFEKSIHQGGKYNTNTCFHIVFTPGNLWCVL